MTKFSSTFGLIILNKSVFGLHISLSILIFSGFVEIISFIDEDVLSYIRAFAFINFCW